MSQMPSISSPFAPRSPRRGGRAGKIVIALVAAAIGTAWIVQTARRGKFTADPSGVTMVISTTPANGDREVLPNIFISAYLNPGHAIDRGTLDERSAVLYRAADHIPVAAQVSTSAACDDIVLTPVRMLEPQTQYTFEVKGVKDSTGAELLPFSM